MDGRGRRLLELRRGLARVDDVVDALLVLARELVRSAQRRCGAHLAPTHCAHEAFAAAAEQRLRMCSARRVVTEVYTGLTSTTALVSVGAGHRTELGRERGSKPRRVGGGAEVRGEEVAANDAVDNALHARRVRVAVRVAHALRDVTRMHDRRQKQLALIRQIVLKAQGACLFDLRRRGADRVAWALEGRLHRSLPKRLIGNYTFTENNKEGGLI